MPQIFHKHEKTLFLMSCIVGLLLGVHFFRPPTGGLWTQVFFNSLHVPVFGAIAVCIYLAQSRQSGWQRRALLALVATAFLGMLSEIAQIFTSRDASFRDLIADFAGAMSFLAILLAIWPPPKVSGRRRFLLAGVALLMLGWVLAPLAVVGAAYYERFSQFPTIARSDSRFGHVLKRAQNIDYRIIASTDGEPAHALVTLRNKPWPGVAFHDVQPDWSEFTTLIVDIRIEGDAPLPVNLRVHDEAHKANQVFSDRFSRSYMLDPGNHTLRIPLIDLINAPRNRPMDLTQISELILFSDASNAGRSFRLYEIRLE